MDAAAVDSRRKLVLIRRDDVEHLLLIGGPTDVVVEQNIVMESRANARSQASRIEPEHIERFRQHEASITTEVSERPALSQQSQQTIQKTKPFSSILQLIRLFNASPSQSVKRLCNRLHPKRRNSVRLRALLCLQ